ncbi:MAG: CBS domain-containing protein [Anaerolineae bacterium]
MLVRDYMTRHPLLAAPDMSVVDAQRFMVEANVRRLPVVGDGKRLLGLITRQSLLVDLSRLGSLNVWELADQLARLTVKDVMIKARDVITIGPDATIEEAARLMVEKKIGCLPVLEDGAVIGIITETDLLAQLTAMMDLRHPGVRATVRMPADLVGGLARLVAAIAAQGWGINALGGSVYPKDPSQWDAVIKIEGVTKEELLDVLRRVEGETVVDIREV